MIGIRICTEIVYYSLCAKEDAMSYIEFKNVKKIYRMGDVKIKALSGVDFTIDKGNFAVIAGPSGAGKSTILNLLGGMDTSTTG